MTDTKPTQERTLGVIIEGLAAGPVAFYIFRDLSLTPLGQSFEQLALVTIAVTISCAICTAYQLDCGSNLAQPITAPHWCVVLGAGMILIGSFFTLGWVVLWFTHGNTPIDIIHGVLFAEVLPIDFRLGYLAILWGAYVLLSANYHDQRREVDPHYEDFPAE